MENHRNNFLKLFTFHKLYQLFPSTMYFGRMPNRHVIELCNFDRPTWASKWSLVSLRLYSVSKWILAGQPQRSYCLFGELSSSPCIENDVNKQEEKNVSELILHGGKHQTQSLSFLRQHLHAVRMKLQSIWWAMSNLIKPEEHPWNVWSTCAESK